MGLFYVFTCGGLFVGWLIDLFTLPRQVQMANLLAHYQHESSGSILRREIESVQGALSALRTGTPHPAPPPARVTQDRQGAPQITDEALMLQLLRAAQKHEGRLSVTQGVIETGILFGEVERVLQNMVQSNYVYVDNDATTGVVVYVFKELF